MSYGYVFMEMEQEKCKVKWGCGDCGETHGFFGNSWKTKSRKSKWKKAAADRGKKRERKGRRSQREGVGKRKSVQMKPHACFMELIS